MAETANDMPAHEKTYGSFIGLLKFAVPVIAIIALFVVVIIS